MLNAEEKKELIEETKARRRRKRSGRTCSDAADQRNQNDKDSMQEEIYKSLVQNIPCAVYSAFPGEVGPTTFMSNKWKDWTGCSPEELYQYPQAWPRCIHPDDRERTVKAYAGACRDEVPYSLEYRIVHKDTGQVRYARDQGLLSKDKKNTVLRVDGIITDITEHKQAEKALRDSREWFRMMLENLPNVAVQGYGPDGTVHYWNKANESIYGYTAEEALGKDLVELIIPPEMRDYVREAIAHGARTGEMPPASELNLMHKDGSRVPVWSSHAVVRRAGREPELFCIDVDLCELKRTEEMLRQAHDELEVRVKGRTAELLQANEALQIQITERMKVEDALRQSEICYKSVVENTGEGIVVVQDGKLQFANSYVETALGHTREELMSRPFMEFVHPDDRDRVMNIHVRRFKGEEIPPVYELRGIDGHGDTRWLENNGILIEWNGRPATLNFLRDVTDRKKVEEALRKSEEQYRQLVDTSPHGIQEADVEGKIIFANSAFHRIYGYEDGELIGKSICDLPSTTQERDQIRQFIRHLVEDRPEPSPYFGRSLTKNGRTIDVQVDWNYVLDVDGNVEGFTSIITDITERKRSQETLHKSEIRHRELFNSMSSGVA
ncbi:MAG: PAS domain S-box protein, partial [Planctomycetota bacterium]|nr:PAS domain S-box protein [Planctomycetota bacterium]